MPPLELHGKNVFLAGQFVALPRRRLQSFLKAAGATVVRCDERRYPPDRPQHLEPARRIDLLVQGARWEAHPSLYPRTAHPDARCIDEQELVEMFGMEDEPQARLERLRELAHTPSFTEADWRHACCLLEAAPAGAALDLAVDYLEHRDLPNTRRFPLTRWLERAGAGNPEPRLRVARGLQLDSLRTCRDVPRLMEPGVMEDITHLEVGWASLSQSYQVFPISLIQAGAWPRVKSLHIAPTYEGARLYDPRGWTELLQEALVKLLELPRWEGVLRRVTLDPVAVGGLDVAKGVLEHVHSHWSGEVELSPLAQVPSG